MKRSMALLILCCLLLPLCLTGCLQEQMSADASSAAPAAEAVVSPSPYETPSAGPSEKPSGAPAEATASSEKTVELSEIPAYSGSPYVVLYDNEPLFSREMYTTQSYETYGELDALGRCTCCLACIGKDLMPTEERGEIGQIKPTGWVTSKYDFVDGKYLYNRCHLIGWQLTGENANVCNLITGTRYMNVEGMLPFENMVADYIKETGNHVLYRVTPIFEGENLLADGVELEAYSVENAGEGISFHVYCYNVQPGVVIEYATGENHEEENKAVTVSAAPQTASPSPEQTEMVWIPESGSKYHSKSTCSGMKNATQISKEEAIRQGYEPCKRCH